MKIIISEIFESIQGEGKYTGTPMIFVRISGCTRTCWFCDTKYHTQGIEMDTKNIIEIINNSILDYVCWTGGEPLLQKKQIFEIMDKTSDKYHHIETNGDLLKDNDMFRFNYIACSPKERKIAKRISIFLQGNPSKNPDHKHIDIKVVTDLEKEGIDMLEYATCIMPLTSYTDKDKKVYTKVWEYCVKNNIRFTPRLQTIFGRKRGI